LFASFARVEVFSGRVWEDGELGGDWGFWCLVCEFFGIIYKTFENFLDGDKLRLSFNRATLILQ
jgi:hypothetical protein